jgi:hypothetical protein
MLIWGEGRRVGIRALHSRIMGLDDRRGSRLGREGLLGGGEGRRWVGRESFMAFATGDLSTPRGSNAQHDNGLGRTNDEEYQMWNDGLFVGMDIHE